jgi:nucleoside-diphosphate-sugar epimerase
MKKVLLTGARGFIGTHCLEVLVKRGYEVHAISAKGRWNSAGSDVNWHHADLHNAEQIVRLLTEVRPQYLLHLAWYVEHGVYWNSPENLRWVRSSLSLLQAFIDAGGRRVVTAGSCAEYDWNYGYCREDLTPLNPATLYGVCKDALQKMSAAACREAGISSAWGRLFYLYGPGEKEKRLVPAVVKSLLRGEEALCTDGEQLRDYLYVKDAAEAFIAILESNLEGPVNIASGKAIKLKDLISELGKEAGNENMVKYGTIKADAADPPVLLADTDRLKNGIDWQPHYSLEQGIKETVKWWKSKSGH